MAPSILADELNHWKQEHPNHLLVDVREDYEFEDYNIGGVNIPLEQVISRVNELPEDKSILFCCKTGKRSAAIAFAIKQKFDRDNIFTLQGGVEAVYSLNQS